MATKDPVAPVEGFWTNRSVRDFAEQALDPIEAITDRAREVVFDAVQDGWSGPPFDPLILARRLGLEVVAQEAVADARVIVHGGDRLRLEYNPSRPRGRLRFSIAHEIAHTFFADVGEEVRHRTGSGAIADEANDDWQLELLCNIAASELLVPALALPDADLDDAALDLNVLMDLRSKFDVSTEAMLRRVAQATSHDVSVFAAARLSESSAERFRIDYTVPSRMWDGPVSRGAIVQSRLLASCSAVGYIASGRERWSGEREDVTVQAVGIPPYPGRRHPRVAGLIVRGQDVHKIAPITYLTGDATQPQQDGRHIIAHIVNDRGRAWGGQGFAVQLGRTHPQAAQAYRAWTIASPDNLTLGNVHIVDLSPDLTVASMVAQQDFGDNAKLSYGALKDCLETVQQAAVRRQAAVHLPRIGTGQGQATWELIEEVLQRTLSDHDIEVVVYTRPGDRATSGRRQ